MDHIQRAIAEMKQGRLLGERRAAAERLEDMLSNDDFLVMKLNCNSVLPDKRACEKVTWNVVFTEVLEYFAKETDKASITLPNRLFYIGLVSKVFEKSIVSNRPLIAWSRVHDFIVTHLQKERHATYFANELMGILQRFLEVDFYRSSLDATAYIELIKALLKCHKKNQITTGSLLSCLKLCVTGGSQYDLFVSTVRSEVVNFYCELIQKHFGNAQQHILSYLQGLIELCNQNAIEFRGILCNLGETVIPFILQIPSFNEEEEVALVEFLLIQYSLHMPYDCEMSSNAFYAGDPAKWKEILRLSYSYCIDIVEERGRKNSTSVETLSERFLLLAAKCTKQISSPKLIESDNSDDEDGSVHTKKKMRYKSFNTIISDVSRKPLTEGHTVWMRYFNAVLTNFPELIETKINLSNLLHLGANMFNTRFMVRREFYELFSCLLEAEKYLKQKKVISHMSDTWGNVWDLTIKCISVCENKHAAVHLLRKILAELRPTNLMPLLLLYVNNYMPLEKCSVELLAEYLAFTALPLQIGDSNLISNSAVFVDEEVIVTSCPRLALIRWLMNVSNSNMSGFEQLVATVMCSLIVKQTDCLIKQEIQLATELKVFHYDFEIKLLETSFVKRVDVDKTDASTRKKAIYKIRHPSDFKFFVLQKPADRLADALQMDYEKIKGVQNVEGNQRVALNYKAFISKVCLYLYVLNVIEKHSIAESGTSGQIGFRAVLERVFDNGIERCNQYVKHRLQADTTGRSPDTITSIIECTQKLFANRNLCDKVCTFLSQKLNIIDLIKRVFRSHLGNYVRAALNNIQDVNSMFFVEDLPSNVRMLDAGAYERPEDLFLVTMNDLKYEKMSLSALNFLIEYGLVCNHRSEHFIELIKDLMTERAPITNMYLFDASILLMSGLSQILGSPELQDLVINVVELFQKLCRGYYIFPRCTARLWAISKVITPHLAAHEGVSRVNFMILVGTLFKFLNAKTPKAVYRNAFDAISVLAKYDRGLVWSQFTPAKSISGVPTTVWMLEELHGFLNNKFQEIRQLAADSICAMYEHALPFDYSKGITDSQEPDISEQVETSLAYQERRKRFLDLVFQALVDSFDVDVNLTPQEIKDEAVNRTSLTLSLLTRLIFAYPYSQKQNIMFLFMMVKLKNIDVQLANRALEYASTSSTKTMCCYLSYVLKKILKLTHAVEDLPYQFFGCITQNAFLTKFRSEICVEYFEHNKTTELEALAKEFKLEVKDLIKECYGLILARLTPGLAVHTHQLAKSNDVHKRLISTLGGKDTADTLMATCIGDVVLHLISLTFEPSVVNAWGFPEIKMSEPVPPHYPESTIETCLNFLKSASPLKNMSLIGFLSKTSHHSIYKILLRLSIRIHEAHDHLEKYWRLHQFSFITNLILKEPRQIFESMMQYVCSFIFNAYLRLLKTGCGSRDEEENLRFLKVVIVLITKLVQQITEEHDKEMVVFFSPVIRGIVSVTVEFPQLAHTAKTLLDFLLKEKMRVFSDKIVSLDPFPSSIPEFEEYNRIHMELKYGSRRKEWTLSEEFERFLEGIDGTVAGGSCTQERLQFLRELLITRKRDLDRMVKNMESKRFSEECETEPLHCIIKMLTDIASSPVRCEELAIEACKCLGEIGPVDLSVLVLPPYKSQGKIMLQAEALRTIVNIVCGYLSSTDIKLVEVAGNVLRSIFEFEECVDVLHSILGLDKQISLLLLPFRCTQKERIKKSSNKVDSHQLEGKLGLNEMDEGIDYKTWLTRLSVGIIECFKGDNASLVSILRPLCELRLDFCEDVLPYLVYLCLYGGRSNPLVKKTMTGYFRNFFNKFVANLSNLSENSRSITPSSNGTSSTVIYMNKLALRTLMRVIQFLRRHSLPQEMKGNTKPTPFDNNFWIDINYLDVARAAQYCGAYLTSILYIEIAATQSDNRTYNTYESDSSEEDSHDHFYTQGASVYPQNRSEAYKMEKLLLKAYSNIGESDAAFGCGSARFGEGNVHHIEQTMDWSKLLMVANGSSVNTDSCSDAHVAQSFKGLGVYNILWTYLKGVESQNQVLPDDLHQAQFECGWRLSQWNLNTDKPTYIKGLVEVPSQADFQRSIYESVQSALMEDQENHLTAIKNGYRSVHTELRHATLESSVNLYGFMSRLQMLRVVEDFAEKRDESGTVDMTGFLGKWKLQDRIPVGDFKFQEPVLFLRNVLLRAYDTANARINLESEITESLLGLISKAREASNLDYADTAAIALSSLISKPCLAREFEVAKNKWARGKPDNSDALFIMNQLLKKSLHDDDLYPSLLLRYGEWLSETHCERPCVILEKYLQKACNLYEKRAVQRVGAPQQDISKAYIVLAKYADAQYQNVTKYMSSDVFQAKVDHVNRTKSERHLAVHAVDNALKMNAIIMQKHSCNDDDEIKSIQLEQKKFLKLALRHYLKGLKTSNDNDLLIFRAISLWLENGSEKDEDLIEDTTRIFGDETLPSYKYIVVLHQLSARLHNKASPTNNLLKDILLKCAQEHPYHTLPVLLTQASLHKDDKKNSGAKIQLADRVQAAADIVRTLSKMPQLKQLVSRMESFWLALINLANINDGARNQEGVKRNIPNEIARQLNSLDMVAVPTASVPVLSSFNYKDSFVGIAGFGREYSLVGGINSPKKIVCRGTNGMNYNMLLKGQDDLRQDAVMQQVFGVMNKLLQVEHKTKVRRLHIRTYRVIPLSQRTGLIEWVENTQTLGDYLTGQSNPSRGAHVRYHPNEYRPLECRKMMQDARNTGDNEKRYSTYISICEHFKPVFRHFFFENFKEAGVFFEKRLAYTRSVATNSIVGYILGLGDRHVLNILIDTTTAELIHIDLGVAFEQGRILPTPETIPFRLTRDIVDGMGMSGPEGVFRKSSEMTMEVLRNNSDIILTVLQVLLYDPLYMWTLSSDRVARVQPSDSSKGGRKSKSNVEETEESANERNYAASRVLLRLRQKLMGIEEEGGQTGAMSSGQSISIDGHVSLLIQRAMDPEKLSKLFAGWQPYL